MTGLTNIDRVTARRVWDSRGRPTVEADVILENKSIGRAIAPAGASTGSGEAVDLRDGGSTLAGFDVTTAIDNIKSVISPALSGLAALDQTTVDQTLLELDGTENKARLGGNAMIAVSMATLHAAAQQQPLWQFLLGDKTPSIPLPEIQIFGGGAHAGRRVDIQDFMIMPVGATSFVQALEWTAEVYHAAGTLLSDAGTLQGIADEGGFWPAFQTNEEALDCLVKAIERAGYTPGEEVAIALDVAATEFFRNGRYHLALDNREYDTDALAELLLRWIERYPILSIEDPFAENDTPGMQRFTQAVGDRIQVIGDDYLVTNARRVERAAAERACNGLLVKPNQAGTITETRAALETARQAGFSTIVSARSGETEDVTIAHLAVGWSAGQIKVGSFARSERMAKWNELLRIEEALGASAKFAGASAFHLD
ncbi:MAG: phosphopyruvate hydratase [Pseudomonadota bacterium]|nr:phosphopyruvate hydratase [Pseudomonadota bacterium]